MQQPPREVTQAVYCAEASRACQEPIAGTAAAETSIWIALEYAGPWGRKALRTSGLSAATRAHLAGWMDTVPGSRVQLIKHDRATAGAGATLLIALASEQQPALYQFQLDSPDAVQSFDLAAVLRRDPALAARRVDGPVVLVCTNGQRDRCCAKFGVPVYRRFAALAPARAWQTTHIGGHRFAATLVVLPHGIVYGHLGVDEVEPCLRAHERGELYSLARLRGRSCHSKAAQAAESMLRARLGDLQLESLRRLDEQVQERGDASDVQVRFQDRAGTIHEVRFIKETQTVTRPKGCGEPPQVFARYRPA